MAKGAAKPKPTKSRWVTSPAHDPDSSPETTPKPESPPPREPSPEPEPEPLPSSQHSNSSTSSSSTDSSVTLPSELFTRIAQSLHEIAALATLSSLSLASHDSHDVAAPLLFSSITLRNHRQLSSILSSLEIPDPASKKRNTRLSGPKCDRAAKLARFRATTHLTINHLPSPDNLAKLSALQETFSEKPIFPSVTHLHLGPVLTHRFHPTAFGKAAGATARRLKDLHLIHILAHPAALSLDLRGADDDFIRRPKYETPHGCTCAEDFCALMGEQWVGKGRMKSLTVHVDAPVLSTHYFSTTATGPALEIRFTPPTPLPQTSTPPPTKRTRSSSCPSDHLTIVETLAIYVLNRVRNAVAHKGGKTLVVVGSRAREEGEEEDDAEDLDSINSKMIARAKELAGEEQETLFGSVKARQVLKGLTLEME